MKLQRKQKFVLLIIFWLMIAFIIFPPYQDIMVIRKINCGSPFIFGTHYCPMDTPKLMIRLIATLLVGAVIFLLVSYQGKYKN